MSSGQLKFLLDALKEYYDGKIVVVGGMASIAHGCTVEKGVEPVR